MLRQTTLVIIAAVLFTAGCQGDGNDIPAGTWAALQQGDGYELLSLDPGRETEPPPDHFHGWRVLGRTAITDPATRKKLNEALRKGARENTGMAAACFNPRHGIHVVHNGKAYDLVICFECLSVMGFEAGQRGGGFRVSESPQPAFDKVLRAAGVPLAEESK